MIGLGIQRGGKTYTWAGGFSDVEIMYANGYSITIAPIMRAT
jgi:hypothetical protein